MRPHLILAAPALLMGAVDVLGAPSPSPAHLSRRGVNEFLKKVAEDIAFGPSFHDAEPMRHKAAAETLKSAFKSGETTIGGWRLKFNVGTSSSQGKEGVKGDKKG